MVTCFSPRRRLYPPAFKPYGLEAEPEAESIQIHFVPGRFVLEVVRYIHLNPLRAGIVKELKGLNTYPYCGHYALMGKTECGFQDVDYILNLFGKKVPEARRLYLKFVKKGVAAGRRPDLTAGGL
jgi:hypothetical protein